MRVKWSRNLDVPVQQRGQTSTKDSNKDDKRKGFLQIFKFRDRKNEDERKKRNETVTQPPKEKTDAKIRKTVTFADQPSPGASVVCNRKGRRVSADAVDMTIFKVSKCELPDKSQVPSEQSPLFKRNEVSSASTDVKILDTERKQSLNKSSSLPKFASKGKQTSIPVLSDKKNNCCEAEVHSLLDDQKTIHNNNPNLSRTSNKDEACTQMSKIPIPISKESFCATGNIFKTDFWTNNAETRIPVSLRLGQENVFAESGRKELGQTIGNREEKRDKIVFDQIPVPETSASEKTSCKDAEIRIDTDANRRVSSGETNIKHIENIKHTSIKTTEYSPVGYCGSKLVSPKRKVQVNYSAAVPGEHGFPESTHVQNTELKRFTSEDFSRQTGDFAAKEPEETISTSQEINLENKSDHLDKSAMVVSDNATDGLVKDELIPISIPVGNSEEISYQKKLSSPTIISEDEKCANDDSKILVPDIKKEPQFDDVALHIPEISGSVEKTVDTGEKGNSTLLTTANNAAVKNMGKFRESPAINDFTSSVHNPVQSNVERNVESLSCSTENVLADQVKDGVFSTADSPPIRVNSGIENMRNLLDMSVIIVNYKELSSKPWMYSILNQSKEKYPSTKEKISCEGDTGSCNTTEDSCIKTDPTFRDDKIHAKEILPIQNGFAEYESAVLASKMTSGDANQSTEETFPKSENAAENQVVVEMGHGLHNVVGKIVGKGDSFKTETDTELDNRDSICKLINYDKVAFIDEQVDIPEETTAYSDIEMKTDSRNGDCSAKIALNSEIANGDRFKTKSSQIVEAEQKEEISEVDSYYQNSSAASILIEHSTDNEEIIKFDDVLVHCHHISESSKLSLDDGHHPNQLENGLRPSVVSQDTEKVSKEAVLNAVFIDGISLGKKNELINSEEVHTSLFFTENNKEKFDVLKNVCEVRSQTTNIQFEQHLAAVDVVCHHPPLLEAERATTTDSKFIIQSTVESEGSDLRHKGSSYGVLSLDNYESLEFIDDYPEEETDNETPSIDVYKKLNDVSSWDDSGIGLPCNDDDDDRMNVLNERKSLQSSITQDGNTAGFNSVHSSILKSGESYSNYGIYTEMSTGIKSMIDRMMESSSFRQRLNSSGALENCCLSFKTQFYNLNESIMSFKLSRNNFVNDAKIKIDSIDACVKEVPVSTALSVLRRVDAIAARRVLYPVTHNENCAVSKLTLQPISRIYLYFVIKIISDCQILITLYFFYRKHIVSGNLDQQLQKRVKFKMDLNDRRETRMPNRLEIIISESCIRFRSGIERNKQCKNESVNQFVVTDRKSRANFSTLNVCEVSGSWDKNSQEVGYVKSSGLEGGHSVLVPSPSESGVGNSFAGLEELEFGQKKGWDELNLSYRKQPKISQPSFGHGKYGGSAQTPTPPVWSTRVELAQEIQRLGTLCEARTKELNHMKMNFRQASLGFDAFVVLFQYLTEELDAFSQPRLMLELERTHAALEEAEAHLQQYQKEFDELKAKHSQELCELERELNQSHQETIENLTLNHTAEIEELRQSHDKQLAELTESQLKQCQEVEEKHSIALLDLKNEHCQQIEELKMFHADQIEAIENSHHETRMELNSQLKELEQQCKDLKHQAKLVEEALQRDTDTKIQWISAKKADLEKEVDSLKTVLDMRRTEIHSLRKENLEMKKELEKLPVAKEKIKMLEAKAEDLQALVNQKIQVERQLSSDHQHLKENYEKESKVNTRLSMENEELMWKLKQNAEANLILSSSFSGSSEAIEKSLSPLKSPSKQSVSLPMFFHSIENDIANAEKNSVSASSTAVTPCKKQFISARKCSSPVRTPSFVAASPPGPCSRRCKVDLKVAVSPRKQSYKSHSSEKKLSSRDASSVSGHASAETAPLKVKAGLQQQSTPIRKGGGTVSQAKYLDEIHYNEELVSMLDESNGSSDDGLCSREMENSDTLLNFEHYNMLITNEMLSRKYRELTHLEKSEEFTHTFEEPINSSLISNTNNDCITSEKFSNVAENACHNSSSSRDFTFNNQHFMENEQKECPFFPHQFDYSFLQKKDDSTISPLCENAGDLVVSNSTNTICETLPSHQPSGSSSVSVDVSSQVSLTSSDTNCIHPFQSSLLQERNSVVPDSKNSNIIGKDLLLDQS